MKKNISKKTILIILIFIITGLAIAYFLTANNYNSEIPKITTTDKNRRLDKIASYAWSANENEIKAASELAQQIQNNLRKSPDFAVLFSSVNYNNQILLQQLNKLLPNTKIYGGTACLGPMVGNKYLGNENKSVAMLGIKSNDIVWGIGSAEINNSNPEQAGKQAVMSAIQNANQGKAKMPNIILITAAPGFEEQLIQGIEQVTGNNVPIFGGSSADNNIQGKWMQFSGNTIYSNGISIAVAYTNLKIAYAYESGYPVTEQTGIITKAKGRRIYEINNKPAAEVYNNWTGGMFNEQIQKPGKVWGIVNKTALYPIAKILHNQQGEPFYLSIHPLSINTDHSLDVFANVNNQDEIALLHGSWDILMNRFRTTPEQAMKRFKIKKGNGLFALYIFCAGTMLAIPEDQRQKMPLLLKNTIGDIPFIGNFTFGEQGFVPGIGNQHGNLVNSIIIFSKQ